MSASTAHAAPPGDLKKRLQWLMFFRVLIASFFLGIAAIIHLQRSESYLAPFLVNIYALTGGVYCLTIIYLFLLPLIKRFVRFAAAQILVDCILITVLLYLTGGINSIFAFMYSISIISASLFLLFLGGILTATASSFCYSLVIILQHYGYISPVQSGAMVASGFIGTPIYYPLIINISSFYVVAFLSSFLAEQAKRSRLQLQTKQVDMDKLEALNECIIQSMTSGLLTLDLDRRVITFNQAACDITGLSFSQAYLKRIEDVFPGLELPMPFHEPALPAVPITRFETTFVRHDNKELYLGLSLSALRDDNGRHIGAIMIFQDLTSFKEMQKYIRRMDRLAAVGRLSTGIAHEVRNPLASISGSIQVLRKSLNLNDSDKRLMDIIIRESNHLSALISDFTQFARPVQRDKERLRIKFLIDEVVDIFKNSPECSHVSAIHEDIQENLYIHANYQQCKQVLWNLLINAAQAIDSKRGGDIAIRAKALSHPPRPVIPPEAGRAGTSEQAAAFWIEIQIEDTGCGIDSQNVDRIFDPFFTTKSKGTGLGLSIVHRIVQEHNGTITAKNRAGNGTTFSIHLPADIETPEKALSDKKRQ